MAPVVSRELLITYGSWPVDSVAAAVGGNTTYTMEDVAGDGNAPAWMVAGVEIHFYNHTNSANDGTFTIQSVSGLDVVVNNASGVLEASDSPGLSALPVAGASDFMMHEKHQKDAAYVTRNYTFDVVISDTTEATFEAKCHALEQAFRTPRQRLRLLMNNTVFDDMNPTAASGGNTGFHQSPTITKVGDDFDTGRSRHYQVQIGVQLPADLPGQSGRQDSSIDLSYDGNRIARCTISGTYTALGENDARAQYDASIATYAAAVFTALGLSNMELQSEQTAQDDIDKILIFTRVYDELIYDQSSAGRDHAGVVQGTYVYTRAQNAPGDSDPGAKRLEDIKCDFSCKVDKTSTTSIRSLWLNTIRPYILAQARSIFNLSQVALVGINVDLNKSSNLIGGTLDIKAVAAAGGSVVQASESTSIFLKSGKRLIPVWDGNIFARHVYDGPADLIRTVRRTLLVLGGGSGSGAPGGNPAASAGLSFPIDTSRRISIEFANGFMQQVFGGEYTGASQSALVEAALSDGELDNNSGPATGGTTGWVNLTDSVTTTPITIGLAPHQINLLQFEEEVVDQYVDAPTGGGGRPPVAT